MAIRFIIGRAGAGKTHHCLKAIRDRLARDAVDGPRLLFLVPEQAGLQMERAILTPRTRGESDVGGAHRVDVLSFRRLAYRVLDSVTGTSRGALTESARTMVLRHLVAESAGRMRYYGRIAKGGWSGGGVAGFIDRLSATISELMQEAIEPRQLALLMADPTGSESDDPAQTAKLHDLHLIYAAYLDYLGDRLLDPSRHLQLARAHMDRCDWLGGAELWVDGFASFSGQERQTLVALARRCSRVEITAMFDPAVESGSTPNPQPWARSRLFAKPYQTCQTLRHAFVAAGLELADPLQLRPKTPVRFRSQPLLAGLEERLFGSAGPSARETKPSGPPVQLVELPSRRVEVDYAVSRLCRWVHESDSALRYRDVALIVRDLEPYHDLLRQALTARGVPFFIDRRQPVAHHPLVALLRAVAAVAAESLSLESVRLILKSDLVSLDRDSADELENYVLAHGLAGLDAWRGEDWNYRVRPSVSNAEREPGADEKRSLDRINTARQALVDGLDPWLSFASTSNGHTGGQWKAAIDRLLERLNVGKALSRRAQEAEEDGRIDQADEHRQVWVETMSFLDDLAYAFADVRLGIDELVDVLDAGLSGLTLGLVPPTIDQVLVGSIERSRHPDIKAAVLLGFNEGLFPSKPGEDSILHDDDRSRFIEAGLSVAAPTRERIMDESLLVYIALTRASDAVVVTYACADEEGKAMLPSPYVHALRHAFPELETEFVGDPTRTRETWDILGGRDLSARLGVEFRSRPGLRHDDRRVRGRWNELYDYVRESFAEDARARCAISALDDPPVARLSTKSVESMVRGSLRTSVSRLETFAACPFHYFSKFGLGLEERAEAALAPVDVGTVHHAILEDFIGSLVSRNQPLRSLNDVELLHRLHESCDCVAARLPQRGGFSEARGAYMLRRSAAAMARIIRAQRDVSRGSSARPHGAEVPFGFEEPGSLPAVELSTPRGRRVSLRGFVDRVDLAELGDELLGIVIDYKDTRDKKLELDRVFHGLSLQLLAYLLAVAEHGQTLAGRPVRPIGALFVSLKPQYQVVDHPDLSGGRSELSGGTFRPRGVLRADRFEVLDSGTDAGWSPHYNVFRKKEGGLGHRDHSDAVDAGTFDALLDHTRMKLGQLADGILDGNVAVQPARLGTWSACSWCPMSNVCRVETGISDVRFLDSYRRSEVLTRLTMAADSGSAPLHPE